MMPRSKFRPPFYQATPREVGLVRAMPSGKWACPGAMHE